MSLRQAIKTREYAMSYGSDVPLGDVALTPQEVRAEVARERREAKKERQLDRKVKRQNKRSQCF